MLEIWLFHRFYVIHKTNTFLTQLWNNIVSRYKYGGQI
jgi:hypothetical protein